MSTIGTSTRTASGFSASSGGYSLLKTIEWVEGLLERRRSRIALMEMTDSQLKDIGVSRGQAFGEANRPFWK